MGDLLVLWDVDYTLVSADGLGTRLYEAVFRDMFGRDLPVVAPKAGRTDRAILLDTLALAGIADPRAHVDDFLAALASRAAVADGTTNTRVRAMPSVNTRAGATPSVNTRAGATPGANTRAGAMPSVNTRVRAMSGASAAIAALAASGARQSVLTGNIRPLAALKLGLAGLGGPLDLDVGAYGDTHEVRAELVPVARQAAREAYAADFDGLSTALVGDTPLDVEAALATGARAVGVATGNFSVAELAAAGAHAVLPDLTDTSLVLAVITGQS